jgi:hypothetical protein
MVFMRTTISLNHERGVVEGVPLQRKPFRKAKRSEVGIPRTENSVFVGASSAFAAFPVALEEMKKGLLRVTPEKAMDQNLLGGCRKTPICPPEADCAHPSSLRRTCMYASFLGISRALHLDIFQQPHKFQYFDRLLAFEIGQRAACANYCQGSAPAGEAF